MSLYWFNFIHGLCELWVAGLEVWADVGGEVNGGRWDELAGGCEEFVE